MSTNTISLTKILALGFIGLFIARILGILICYLLGFKSTALVEIGLGIGASALVLIVILLLDHAMYGDED